MISFVWDPIFSIYCQIGKDTSCTIFVNVTSTLLFTNDRIKLRYQICLFFIQPGPNFIWFSDSSCSVFSSEQQEMEDSSQTYFEKMSNHLFKVTMNEWMNALDDALISGTLAFHLTFICRLWEPRGLYHCDRGV